MMMILGFIALVIIALFIIAPLFDMLWLWADPPEENSASEQRTSRLKRKTNVEYIGKHGTAITPLRPSGYIVVGGELIAARTEGDFIDESTSVTVVSAKGNDLIVKTKDKEKDNGTQRIRDDARGL